jgi:hypothetical protein
MITHRLGLSHWKEGFAAMADKSAIKCIFHYDEDDKDTKEYGEADYPDDYNFED